MYRKDLIWLYSFGVLMLLLTGYLAWDYVRPEWKNYQEEFRDLVAEKFGQQKAEQAPRGLQQVWLKDLDRVDLHFCSTIDTIRTKTAVTKTPQSPPDRRGGKVVVVTAGAWERGMGSSRLALVSVTALSRTRWMRLSTAQLQL